MRLTIKLNNNAAAEVQEAFQVERRYNTPATFTKGQKLFGQMDNPADGLWIEYGGFVLNIPAGSPIKVEQHETATT